MSIISSTATLICRHEGQVNSLVVLANKALSSFFLIRRPHSYRTFGCFDAIAFALSPTAAAVVVYVGVVINIIAITYLKRVLACCYYCRKFLCDRSTATDHSAGP